MKNKKCVIFIIIIFIFLFCLAGLMNGVIDAELTSSAEVDRGAIFFSFAIFSFLFFIIVIFFLYPNIFYGNKPVSRVLKISALIGFILFLPQSIVLYDKAKYFIHNDLLRFTLYNVIEVAMSRYILRILYNKKEASS